MNCRKAIYLMHDLFNDDIEEYSKCELKKHLDNCPNCLNHFNELNRTNDILKRLPGECLSSNFISKILVSCPKKNRVKKWATRYPIVVAASIFLLFFSISLITYAVPSDEFKLVSEEQQNLIINGNEVIVPEGREICGDIIIENGNLEIKGEVKGNVTVVNGKIFMASASQVAGKTNQVDQIFERIWYHARILWNAY